MTDKAKERIQRQCNHLTLLRRLDLNSGEWEEVWQCADCGWQMELAVLLEEAEA